MKSLVAYPKCVLWLLVLLLPSVANADLTSSYLQIVKSWQAVTTKADHQVTDYQPVWQAFEELLRKNADTADSMSSTPLLPPELKFVKLVMTFSAGLPESPAPYRLRLLVRGAAGTQIAAMALLNEQQQAILDSQESLGTWLDVGDTAKQEINLNREFALSALPTPGLFWAVIKLVGRSTEIRIPVLWQKLRPLGAPEVLGPVQEDGIVSQPLNLRWKKFLSPDYCPFEDSLTLLTVQKGYKWRHGIYWIRLWYRDEAKQDSELHITPDTFSSQPDGAGDITRLPTGDYVFVVAASEVRAVGALQTVREHVRYYPFHLP